LQTDFDIAVIGAGPAGIGAALQLKLLGMNPLVIEKATPGGLLACARKVRNYPGFPGGIKGRDLAAGMARQLEDSGVDVVKARVEYVEKTPRGFFVRTDSFEFEVSRVVLASGTEPRPVPPEIAVIDNRRCAAVDSSAGEEEKRHPQPRLHDDIRGLFPLVEEDGSARILILGGGDLAFDYALSLHEAGAHPVIINRSPKPRASAHLQEEIRARGIEVVCSFAVEAMETGGESVTMRSGDDECNGDYVLLSIGRIPCIDFLSPDLRKELETSSRIEGFYLAGDVHRGTFRQAAIAAGDGVLAAMRAAREIAAGESMPDRRPASKNEKSKERILG
jgi:thioredoxin reductase